MCRCPCEWRWPEILYNIEKVLWRDGFVSTLTMGVVVPKGEGRQSAYHCILVWTDFDRSGPSHFFLFLSEMASIPSWKFSIQHIIFQSGALIEQIIGRDSFLTPSTSVWPGALVEPGSWLAPYRLIGSLCSNEECCVVLRASLRVDQWEATARAGWDWEGCYHSKYRGRTSCPFQILHWFLQSHTQKPSLVTLIKGKWKQQRQWGRLENNTKMT